jgi:hypothetical protein
MISFRDFRGKIEDRMFSVVSFCHLVENFGPKSFFGRILVRYRFFFFGFRPNFGLETRYLAAAANRVHIREILF